MTGIFTLLPPMARLVKNLPAKTGDTKDTSSIPGSERSPGEGKGNPLQHSCLKNSMDRGAWQATVHGIAKSRTKLTLSLFKAKPCLLAMVFKLFFQQLNTFSKTAVYKQVGAAMFSSGARVQGEETGQQVFPALNQHLPSSPASLWLESSRHQDNKELMFSETWCFANS